MVNTKSEKSPNMVNTKFEKSPNMVNTKLQNAATTSSKMMMGGSNVTINKDLLQ